MRTFTNLISEDFPLETQERLRGESPKPAKVSMELVRPRPKSMAEGHLEAADGGRLALIRVCHGADAGQSLTCWLPSSGEERARPKAAEAAQLHTDWTQKALQGPSGPVRAKQRRHLPAAGRAGWRALITSLLNRNTYAEIS